MTTQDLLFPTETNAEAEGVRAPALALASGSPPLLRYTEDDSERANELWKATCGPHSIAAACGKTLDEVRRAICDADVNYRGWMSPTQVMKTLDALGQKYTLTHKLKTPDLCDGINRLQWEGKWLNPGVPARIAYFHTHLVAHFGGWVLCTACLPATWIAVDEWRDFLRKTDQPFHVTHHWSLANIKVTDAPAAGRSV